MAESSSPKPDLNQTEETRRLIVWAVANSAANTICHQLTVDQLVNSAKPPPTY